MRRRGDVGETRRGLAKPPDAVFDGFRKRGTGRDAGMDRDGAMSGRRRRMRSIGHVAAVGTRPCRLVLVRIENCARRLTGQLGNVASAPITRGRLPHLLQACKATSLRATSSRASRPWRRAREPLEVATAMDRAAVVDHAVLPPLQHARYRPLTRRKDRALALSVGQLQDRHELPRGQTEAAGVSAPQPRNFDK